jgi:hypothetical protein
LIGPAANMASSATEATKGDFNIFIVAVRSKTRLAATNMFNRQG